MKKLLFFVSLTFIGLCVFAKVPAELNYSAPDLPEEDFIFIDTIKITGSGENSVKLFNYVNYPSNLEKVSLTILAHDPLTSEWFEYSDTTIIGFARNKTIKAERKDAPKSRYFAVSCSNSTLQVVPKKYKNNFCIFIYAEGTNPNQEIIYPYFKQENATIFSQAEMPNGCDENIRFISNTNDAGVGFTLYVFNSKENKWIAFASATPKKKGDKVFAETLTSKHDVTDYDFIAIESSNGKKYGYALSEKHDDLYVNVSDYAQR